MVEPRPRAPSLFSHAFPFHEFGRFGGRIGELGYGGDGFPGAVFGAAACFLGNWEEGPRNANNATKVLISASDEFNTPEVGNLWPHRKTARIWFQKER